MIGCLPGLRDVDAAIKAIANGSQKLVSGQYPHLDQSYQQLQLALSEAGAGLRFFFSEYSNKYSINNYHVSNSNHCASSSNHSKHSNIDSHTSDIQS